MNDELYRLASPHRQFDKRLVLLVNQVQLISESDE